MAIAQFLDNCAPRTRLDGYPMYVILKDVLRRLLRGQIVGASQAEADLRAQVASLQASLGAAAASHMMVKQQSEQLRNRLKTIESQLGTLASQEASLKDKLWATTNELAQAGAELDTSQAEMDGKVLGVISQESQVYVFYFPNKRHCFKPLFECTTSNTYWQLLQLHTSQVHCLPIQYTHTQD
jgi:septal ring factor EnvC (AmiA/AmiB activator)